ncbi:MAG: hypothetical protein Ct9H300mP23_12470 [Nitrospinota bacterium]|nr:MAG: hypothetical protein Ct9H300mP23_12470 [Nitrospinota bacterium]
MAIVFDYEISTGMPREEVLNVYENFDSIIEDIFPSRKNLELPFARTFPSLPRPLWQGRDIKYGPTTVEGK